MPITIKSGKKQNISAILKKLKTIAFLEDERISFTNAFDYEHINWMLLSILDFKVNLSPSSKRKIITSAINEILENNQVDSENLMLKLNSSLNQHLKKKERTFFLLGSISIQNIPLRKIRFKNTIIRIYKSTFPKPFNSNRKLFLDQNKLENDVSNYSKVVLEIRSKNYQDAFLDGIEKFEILRSLLCLILNKGAEIRYGINQERPINLIRSGKVFTLHTEDGNCPGENYYWTSDNYSDSKIQYLKNSKKK